MESFNRAFGQLVEALRSMTPGSRFAAGLSAAVALACVGYLLSQQRAAPEADLMHGVPVAIGQLPAMEAAFARANLKGYEIRGASIFVPRGQEQAYMAALADANALPLNFGDALSAAISAGTTFENSRQREDRLKIARQAELSLIIRSMPGIETAYVLYDVDSKPGFNREKLITATVSVKSAGANAIDESRVSAIRHLVAGAIAGLKPENVTVSDLNGRTWHAGGDEGVGHEENAYIAAKRTYEQDLKVKILGALCFIPKVTVEPSVVLDRERVTRFKQDRRKLESQQRSIPRPRSNAPTILENLMGGAPRDPGANEETGSDSREQIERESVGLTPISARVSVGVPISYFRKVWQERNPSEPGQPARLPPPTALDRIRIEESAKIQRHVAQLLPLTSDAAKPEELVTVTTFQDIAAPPADPPPQPVDFRQEAIEWLRQSWQTLALVGLAMMGLMVLRSTVRPARVAVAPSAPKPEPQPMAAAIDEKHEAVPAPHAQRFHPPASPFQKELSELVDSDPDAAAKVLRRWIGQTG